MAIVVIIKRFNGLSGCGKGDRFVKIDFRGVSHYSSALQDTEELVEVNESFTWNFGTAVQEVESLQLAVVARNVLRSEKVIARYGLVLQSVVRDGRVSITDTLVDLDNKPIAAVVTFEIRYDAPDGSCSSYATTEMLQDERQMLIDIEENIANLERTLANREEKSRSGNLSSAESTDVKSWSKIKNLVKQQQRRNSANASSRPKSSKRALKSSDATTPDRKSSLAFKTVRSFMRLGKERPSRAKTCESSDFSETRRLMDSSCERATNSNASRTDSMTSLDSDLSFGDNNISQPEEDDDDDDDDDDDVDGTRREFTRAGTDFIRDDQSADIASRDEPLDRKKSHRYGGEKMHARRCDFSLKAQHYQVCITIIEARQLAGLNMDPVVCVQIEDQRKYTSVKESTNCPYYNEYFVFDFHMPPVMLLDKIITLSVQQSRNILRANLTLGTFKLDIATVWAQPDHQFYHKWALLTDPDDLAGGPKGYLKCDISVIGKGDSVKIPMKRSARDEDDIEGNLLLPGGGPIERQRARYIVKVYRADGLPKMNSSVMANVKKAFTGQLKDLVDPYVRISFAGLQGKTSVKRNSYAPVWNEQVIFTEMFPPLCQRIKIQLCDDDPVNGSIIGTHFIDLKEISNDGEKGFLPSFGPAFVHLYGSIRDYSLVDRHSTLNTGLGEGISYRARLLVAIRTEMSDNADNISGAAATSDVEVTQTFPVNETAYAPNEEFFLFATIMDATMIDKKLGEKPMYFELSIGNAGNILDGHNESSKEARNLEMHGISRGCDGIGAENSASSLVADTPVADDSARGHSTRDGGGSWQSTTNPAKPMTHDRLYYFLPYWDDKPCLHVKSVWPDYRRRMYNSNMIGKIVDKLEAGLAEVHANEDSAKVDKIVKSVLDELSTGCNRYVALSKSSSTGGSGLGKTKLDRERIKLCQRELENIGLLAKNVKAAVTKNTYKEKLKIIRTYLEKLKFLLEDPQQSLPDVFVWVISSGKRVAYHRMAARDIIYSIVDEESGRYCATVQNMFLKLPGKKGFGTSGWTVQAKIQIYMWLGILKHKKYLVQGLPKGYEMSNELKNIERPRALAPSTIHYVEKHKFQLRAHMYQARSLIGSDASGLSDPFARVICGEFSKTTQVIDETLSPTWDELVIIDNIIIYGTSCVIKKHSPAVVIELFDRDKVGKSEYIGRTLANTHVKLKTEVYGPPEFPPSLEWYQITRGTEPAGELLAVFELIEYGDKPEVQPRLPDPKYYLDYEIPISGRMTGNAGGNAGGGGIDQGPIFPVPFGIRPTLSRYRIEVLFWGLRDIKRIHLMSVDKPRVDVECAGHILHSSVISNTKKNPNFSIPIKYIDIELPDRELYRPPVTIRAVDCRSFGRYTLVGTHTISSIQKYMDDETATATSSSARSRQAVPLPSMVNGGDLDDFGLDSNVIISLGLVRPGTLSGIESKKEKMRLNLRRKESFVNNDGNGDSEMDDNGSRDWWTKYFASLEAMTHTEATESRSKTDLSGCASSTDRETAGSLADKKSRMFGLGPSNGNAVIKSSGAPLGTEMENNNIALMTIYDKELEAQTEFNEFREWLDTFELYRGKKSGDDVEDTSRIVGTFKGGLKVYKWPAEERTMTRTTNFDPQVGFFQSLPIPSNEPIHVLVRVYIVRGKDLHPCDPNGKADPYVVLNLGDKRISDKDNYVSKQLNPVFGKCFEIEATFPQDSLLTVQILDWDLVGSDDVIGETRIDLENRFYSKHRATCGIARRYDEFGYNKWRDPMKPTQILSKLCKEAKLDPPTYSHGRVNVGERSFALSNEEMRYYLDTKGIDEHLALQVLHRWGAMDRIGTTLIPEHVESRSLYKPEKPGIEQGKLDMWVDMFPMDTPLPGPPIDISPRKPKGYELRVIIWNTEDVVLEDDAFFTGEKMSDIYVKGWLKGPEDCQSTDIHYRSLTGEGNFNWRFIFPFDYLVAEERIVTTRKESLFSWDESEFKIPARLELQVWDADHFSADDFLGAITLDLNRFPRGAKSSKLCTLGMIKTDGSVPAINIFKQKRVKGWWPFYVKKENEDMELTGKVEAEIHLVSRDEADSNPVGHGRSEPDPLDKPSRPDASFVWLLNPIKSIKYIIWHNYKWAILKATFFVAIAVLLLLFFYAIPGYSVKKILGAR